MIEINLNCGGFEVIGGVSICGEDWAMQGKEGML